MRSRFVTHNERLSFGSGVLFGIVDLHRRMTSGRSKEMPLTQVRGVNIRTRIDDEGRAASRDFNRERIVVAVRAAAIHSIAVGIEKQVEIAIATDISARVRKSA